MKLLRYGPAGHEKPGCLHTDGKVRDLSSVIADISSATLSPELLELLAGTDVGALPVVEDPGRLGPCVGTPGKVICIGLNYSDHAAETGATPPGQPIIFHKAVTAICGPNDDVELPRDADRETAEATALADETVQRHLEGKPPRRVIVVPNRIVNVVV